MSQTSFEMEIERDDEIGFILGPFHEVLPDGDWICWARRVTKRPTLFLYFHKIRETFVLCDWINKDRRTCTELHAFPVHPQHAPSQAPEGWLRARCRTAVEMHEEMVAGIRASRVLKDYERKQEAGERDDLVKELNRKGKKQLATEIDSGELPWRRPASSRESQAEMTKSLKKAAKAPVTVAMPGKTLT